MHGIESRIPKAIWLTTPSSTNIGEAAHRDIQREGVKLTLLGAILRGNAHDRNVRRSREAFEQTRVEPRYTVSSTFTLLARNDQRKRMQLFILKGS